MEFHTLAAALLTKKKSKISHGAAKLNNCVGSIKLASTQTQINEEKG